MSRTFTILVFHRNIQTMQVRIVAMLHDDEQDCVAQSVYEIAEANSVNQACKRVLSSLEHDDSLIFSQSQLALIDAKKRKRLSKFESIAQAIYDAILRGDGGNTWIHNKG